MDQYHHTIQRVMSTQNDSNGYRTVLADVPLDGGIAYCAQPLHLQKRCTSSSVVEENSPSIFLDYAHDTDPMRSNQKTHLTRNMIYNGPIGYHLRPEENQDDEGSSPSERSAVVLMLDKVVNRGNYYVTVVSDYDQTVYNDSESVMYSNDHPGLRQLNADTLIHQFASVKRPKRTTKSNNPSSDTAYNYGPFVMYYFPQITTKKSSTPASWQFGCLFRTVGFPKGSFYQKRPPSYQFVMQNVSQKTSGQHNVLKKGAAISPFSYDKTNIKHN
jgi:hypothetical protein